MRTLMYMFKGVKWGRLGLIVLLFLMIAASLFIGGCKENDPTEPTGIDDNSLQVEFTAKANAKTFQLNEKYSNNAEKFNFKFEMLKFYISKFRLVKTDGSELVLNEIDLIDFRADKPHLSFSTKIPAGEYKEIKFGIGVDSVANASDPASYPTTHPLSAVQGTHWGWTTQYRFVMMEGRLDTAQNDTVDIGFAVHTGTNELYREKTFERYLKFTKADNRKITIEIDIDAVLSSIDFKTDHISHTIGAGFPLAEKMADNFANNITLKP